MKCGAHGLLSIASIVQLVCGYEHGQLTETDVTSINAITWHEGETCFPNLVLNLIWEQIGSRKCHRTQAVLTLMKYLFRIL